MTAFAAGCSSVADDPEFARQGAVNTGTFPNLNEPAPVATTQFTPYSLGQHRSTLSAARQNQTTQGTTAAAAVAQSAADRAKLEELRKTHGKATIDAIEGN